MKSGLLSGRFAERELKWMQVLQTHAEGFPVLVKVLPVLTQLGGTHAIVAATLLLFLMTRDGGLCILVCALSHLMIHLLKNRVDRARPYEYSENIMLRAPKMNDPSFPSGHTAAICTLAMQITLVWPSAGLVMWPIAVLVGWSRIYLGVHYPADVVAGALIGMTVPLLFM